MAPADRTTLALLRRNLDGALRSGQSEDAWLLLHQLQELEPLSVETRGRELELLLRCGRVGEASTLARQLLAQFPASARIHLLSGQVAYRRKAYSEAAELLLEADRQSPHWKTRHWLGKALTQAGRFDEAEAVLTSLVAEHSHVRPDLAWLHERQGRIERAIELLEAVVREEPANTWVAAQLERLRGRALEPGKLVSELEQLAELGDQIPEHLLPDYVEGLLLQGRLEQVRSLLQREESRLSARASTSVAWVCHRRLAPDLACRLFLRLLPQQLENAKLLAALEADALKAGRGQELAELYRELAGSHPPLWGRLRNLMRRLAKQAAAPG